jgi:hypothetical protein
VAVTPFGPLDSKEEQSEAERLAVARRYRELHGQELRQLAGAEVPGDVEEVGELSTVPLEALAAVPILGAFLALWGRLRGRHRGPGPEVLLALDADRLYLLSLRSEPEGRQAHLSESWPRADVSVSSVRRKFMRDEVTLELPGERRLRLYAPPLRTNPWTAGVVRALGGEAPEPLDLSGAAEAGGGNAG